MGAAADSGSIPVRRLAVLSSARPRIWPTSESASSGAAMFGLLVLLRPADSGDGQLTERTRYTPAQRLRFTADYS